MITSYPFQEGCEYKIFMEKLLQMELPLIHCAVAEQTVRCR